MVNRKKEELISIVVPVYNAENYLNACLSSIVNQTYKNIEIILINDGSTDQSGIICDEFSKKDSRIKVFHQKNKGAAAAKNLGRLKSSGNFFCFIDSDDEVTTNYVEYLYYLINKQNSDMAIACYMVKSKNKQYNIGRGQKEEILSSKECLKKILEDDGISVSLCAKLYTKNIFENLSFPENYMYEDDATIYKLILNCKTISYGEKSIYTYYVRENSVMTQKFTNNRLILLKYAEDMKSDILEKYPELSESVERKFIIYNFSILRQLVVSKLDENQTKIKKDIISYLKNNKSLILKSNKYSYKEKIAICSLIFSEKIYKICWNMYRKIKY